MIDHIVDGLHVDVDAMACTCENMDFMPTPRQCFTKVGDIGGHDATRHRVDCLPCQHADRQPQIEFEKCSNSALAIQLEVSSHCIDEKSHQGWFAKPRPLAHNEVLLQVKRLPSLCLQSCFTQGKQSSQQITRHGCRSPRCFPSRTTGGRCVRNGNSGVPSACSPASPKAWPRR